MDKQLIELIKQWREGTENYAEQVGYARGSDFAFRKCADDLEKALARIDAERGKEAVAFRLTDGDDVEYNGIDQFSCGRTGGEPLFRSPTIPEGMALVKIDASESLTYGVIGSLEDARNTADAARREGLRGQFPAACVVLDMALSRLLAAAQGERNAD